MLYVSGAFGKAEKDQSSWKEDLFLWLNLSIAF